ncbi:MAG TPA: methylenetetrahydrofolate reductase [Steroidobacteraceae bacterium]|jgi:methylenetetrahydrofolate reductase (NADPH)|nr:methylenetetrahydrofolate reductase [Steroidobacteraceae bacterium]
MTPLETQIRAGKFVVTTELTPPKGIDLSELFAKADALRGWVDAVNLTESPRARMAVEPKSVAHLLIDRGLDPIVQITARDRNRIGIQADLLGAALLGIGNFLFMTGDNPKNGDHPDCKGVFDLNTLEMLGVARSLRAGRDMMGNELKGAPHLFLGATANPGAADLAYETEGVRRKIEAGAQFLQTQPIYDIDVLRRYLDAVELGDVALLAGVIPLKSAKMAGWLNANLPGVRVPPAMIEELERAGPDGEAAVGIDIAARLVREIRKLCAGVHIMALGWEHRIPEILTASGIRG